MPCFTFSGKLKPKDNLHCKNQLDILNLLILCVTQTNMEVDFVCSNLIPYLVSLFILICNFYFLSLQDKDQKQDLETKDDKDEMQDIFSKMTSSSKPSKHKRTDKFPDSALDNEQRTSSHESHGKQKKKKKKKQKEFSQ